MAEESGPVELKSNGTALAQLITVTAWQQRLLPIVVGSVLMMAAIFFVATALTYKSMTRAMVVADTPLEGDVYAMATHNVSLDFQEAYARVALESRAMESRYRINYTLLEVSTWTRLMGFAAGMIMIVTGCLFVISKFEVSFEAQGKGAGHESSMKTNSPGLVLAAAGALLLGYALSIKADLHVTDAPVFLPTIVEEFNRHPPTSPTPAPITEFASTPREATATVSHRAGIPAVSSPGSNAERGRK